MQYLTAGTEHLIRFFSGFFLSLPILKTKLHRIARHFPDILCGYCHGMSVHIQFRVQKCVIGISMSAGQLSVKCFLI
jgi:hypothetical protein